MSMPSFPSSSDLTDRLCRGACGVLFGEEIEFIRHQKGLSLEEAARRAVMQPAEWHALEIGKVPQTWEQIVAIARAVDETRLNIASLVIRYAGAWDEDEDLPEQIRWMYS